MSDQGKAARYFEDLHVYQRARELTGEIYGLTRQGAFAQDHGLVDQIRRAAVSVMSNIAEGHERGSKTETSRPKRQQQSEQQQRLEALRAAQEVNIRSQEERKKEDGGGNQE